MPATTEDRVKARLYADQATAKKALDAANASVQKAEKAITTAAGKVEAALDAPRQAIYADQPKAPTDKQREKAAEALREQGKAVTAFLAAATKRASALGVWQTLQTDKEYGRRLKAAKQIEAKGGSSDGPMSGTEAAKVVLLAEGHAMHYTEITRVALETGVVKLTGKTPEATMSAYLAKATAKGDTFVRVEPGVFDLKERIGA